MAATKSRAVPRRSGTPLEVELSDDQLLGRFNARRDDSAEAAFAALIRRHGPMVWRVCDQILANRHAAEDAFQACFLVLARKSGSIRQPELLGNWLYGVALRTAREAKMRDGRRRRHEAPSEEAVGLATTSEGVGPEVTLIGLEERQALHEELARLPERYRVPLVLCELEGLTYQEAAHRLDCPVSTIGVRLIRGRERLRDRMIRRGIAPATATALASALLGEGSAAALLSAALVDATAQAAVGFVVSDAAAAGLVPAGVLALAEAVLRAMKLARLKVAASAVLAVGLAASLGWVGGHLPVATATPTERGAGRSVPVEPTSVIVGQPATDPAPVAAPAATPAVSPPGTPPPVGEAGASVVPPTAPLLTLASVRKTGRDEVARGEALFFKDWVAHDRASPDGDGLGPVYNETSCVACHGLGAPGGAGPANKNVVLLTFSSRTGQSPPKGLERIHPGFGTSRSAVLHRYGTDSSYRSWRRTLLGLNNNEGAQQGRPTKPEAGEETVKVRMRRIAQQTAPNARLRERAVVVNPEPNVALRVSERNSPALFGAGRLDSIPNEVIVEEARHQAAEVRGKVSRLPDGRLGRFGWKAQVAGLHEFVRSACASELGLEVPGHAQAVSPITPRDRAKGLDLAEADCDALVSYVRALPAPVVVDPDGPHGSAEMRAGRQTFADVGCASCHAPSLGEVRGLYSDMLLHEMGSSLSDSGSYYGNDGPTSPDTDNPTLATPGEWRTPPLWGFRDSGPYLHDGRAETLDEVVALHEGQATQSARRFFALDLDERTSVETFLKSLIAPSAASAPGIVLASELESRVVPESARQAESLIRHQRVDAEARDIQKREVLRQRQLAEAAVQRAMRNFQLAANLDRAGKPNGAVRYYLEVARDAPNTEEGRLANERIAILGNRAKSP